MKRLKRMICGVIMLLSAVVLFNVCNISPASAASYNAHDLAAIQGLLSTPSNGMPIEYAASGRGFEWIDFIRNNPDHKVTIAEVLGWDINNPNSWADYQSAKVEWTLVGSEYRLSSVSFVGANYLIGDVDFSDCTSLKSLSCYFGKMTSLDVSGCTALVYLTCSENPLKKLNISGCTSLTQVRCYKTELTSLDLSSCKWLSMVECYNTPIGNISELKALPIQSFAYTENGVNYYVVKNIDLPPSYTATENPVKSPVLRDLEYDTMETFYINQAVFDMLKSGIEGLYYESGTPLGKTDRTLLLPCIENSTKERTSTAPDGSVQTITPCSLSDGFKVTVYFLEGKIKLISYNSNANNTNNTNSQPPVYHTNYNITVASIGKGIAIVNGPNINTGDFSITVRADSGYRFVGFQDEQGLNGSITLDTSFPLPIYYDMKINTAGDPVSISAVFTDDDVSDKAVLNAVWGQTFNAGQGDGSMVLPLQALMIVPNSTKTLSGADFNYSGASVTFGTDSHFPHGTATVSLMEGYNRVYVEVNAEKGNTVYYCLYIIRLDVNGEMKGVTVENVEINGGFLTAIRTDDGNSRMLPFYGQAKEAGIPTVNTVEGSLPANSSFAELLVPDKTMQSLRQKYGEQFSFSIDKNSVVLTVNGKEVDYDDSQNPLLLRLAYTPSSTEQLPEQAVAVMKGDEGSSPLPLSIYKDGNIIVPVYATGTYEAVYNAKTFTDITGHWALQNINFATARNLFQGVGDDKFDPDGSMSRGMFVTVLSRLDGADLSSYTSSTLADVETGIWYLSAVEWSLAANIAVKTGGNIFSPDQAITRIEMAVMIDNYLKHKEITLPQTAEAIAFVDMQNVSSEEAAAVSRIQRTGIINGKPDNLFDPQGNATRAEVSAIFTRLAERLNDAYVSGL